MPGWHEARAKGLGASEAAAVLAASRWDGPLGVWQRKKAAEIPTAEDLTWPQRRGLLYEPAALQEYGRLTGREVLSGTEDRRDDVAMADRLTQLERFSADTGLTPLELEDELSGDGRMMFCLDGGPLFATPDALVFDQERGWGVLEAKTVADFTIEEWDSGRLPQEYGFQLQQTLGVTGLEWGAYIALSWMHEPIVLEADPDRGLWEWMRPRLEGFWERHVVKDSPPAVMASEDQELAREALHRLYGKSKREDREVVLDDDAFLDLPERLEAALERRKAFGTMQKGVDAEVKWLENVLIQTAGNAQRVRVGDVVYEVKTQKRRGYTAEATSWTKVGKAKA